MNKETKSKILLIAVLLLTVLCLCACKVKSTKRLTTEAKATYGPAKVVSTYTGSDYSEVILQDKAQGFEYSIRSSLSDLAIDGSSFGKVQNTYSDFDQKLAKHCLNESKAELDQICGQYNAIWSGSMFGSLEAIMSIKVEDPKDAKAVSEACAKVLQKQNVKKRLDNSYVYVEDQDNNRLGSAKIKTAVFRNPDEEVADELLEVAKSYDEGATYVKMENKTLKDTGLDLYDVAYDREYRYPEDLSFPIRYYYFKDSTGRQFYICDFYVYDTRNGVRYYTNY